MVYDERAKTKHYKPDYKHYKLNYKQCNKNLIVSIKYCSIHITFIFTSFIIHMMHVQCKSDKFKCWISPSMCHVQNKILPVLC